LGSAAAPVQSVILISIDTLTAEHMGLYGYARNTTPFLAELAHESVVFENAYSPSVWTLPSHFSIFTGVDPYTHWMIDLNPNGLPPHRRCKPLAALLHRGKSRAAWAGPPPVDYLDGPRGLTRGFDEVHVVNWGEGPEEFAKLDSLLDRL